MEWWPGLDEWLGEESDQPVLHAVGDLLVDGPTEVTLRTEHRGSGGPAFAVSCDGKHPQDTGPDRTLLCEGALTEPATRLRILTVGEYVEVYADGVFALTTVCYSGQPATWTVRRDALDHTLPVRPIRLPDPYRDDACAIRPGPAEPVAGHR